jgi:TrpR-related protein YerC/YecD
MRTPETKDTEDLYRTILRLNGLSDARKFFRDLLTENEIAEMTERWKAARMLAGGHSYAEIADETGLSSRTIARVARWLKRGKGGYALLLKRVRD